MILDLGPWNQVIFGELILTIFEVNTILRCMRHFEKNRKP